MNFIYQSLSSRVIFGTGTLKQVSDELERLKVSRPFLIATARQESQLQNFAKTLRCQTADIFPRAVMHTPVDVTERALNVLKGAQADCLVAFGGGSTIGLSKALALRTDLPQIVIPTTYAGSEMTPILGQTEGGRKTTIRDLNVLPEIVIYDVELTYSLPPIIAGPSGMNAIAHAVEALYAENNNPVISLMAEESIASLGRALPRLMEQPSDIIARKDALYGAWLAGICLGSVGMALHHKICHTLGGTFDLPHADIHCLMLPYCAAYNRDTAQEAMSRVARALDDTDAPSALYKLMRQTATRKSLAEFGLTRADLEHTADIAVQNPYYNPRPVTREGILELLDKAYRGVEP